MSDNESPTTAIRLPFPKVVCGECGHVCAYVIHNPDPDGEPWLQCIACSRKRPNVGTAIEKQDRLLDSIEDTTLELSATTPIIGSLG